MADLVLGVAKSVVEGTLTRTQQAIEAEQNLRETTARDLVFITAEFQMMQSVLDSVDEDRARIKVVRTWARHVRDLAYDVEDCVELVAHLDDRPDWWRRFFPACLRAVLPLDEAAAEIKRLKARVKDLSQRHSTYGLVSVVDFNPAAAVAHQVQMHMQQLQPQPPPAAAEQTGSLGINLTQFVTTKLQHEDLGRLISVWGTATADLGAMSIIIRETYQDPQICRIFGCRGWVKLAHPFNPHKFIRSLVAQFYTNSCLQQGTRVDLATLRKMERAATRNAGLCQEFMKQVTMVNDGRYLLVLENLRTMGDWDAIRACLPDTTNNTSLVIVSTEQREIASLCIGHSCQVLELNQQSADHSVCVFFKEADGLKGKETARQTPMENQVSLQVCLASSSADRYLALKRKVANELTSQFYLTGRESEMKQLGKDIAKARVQGYQVMSVWGIAGVGKSALIRSLFCDTILDPCRAALFDRYGWVDVSSRPFKLRDFSWSLLAELYSEPLQATRIQNSIQECQKILKEHRCLVVIDGLHSMKDWDLIQPVLVSRPSSSVIVIVTSEQSVATRCADDNEVVFSVKGLQEEAAVKLFKQQAHRKNPQSYLKESDDVELRQLILKCGGIPKLIVSVADFLAPHSLTWMDRATSMNRRFMQQLENSPKFASLQPLFSWMDSYLRTCPDFLKQCIFYMSIFPTGKNIRRRRLVRRWIAEGYIKDTEDSSAEASGEWSFSQIVDPGIIQQPQHSAFSSEARMVECEINGFVGQYILSRSTQEKLVLELVGSCPLTSQRTGRHLIIRDNWDRDEIVFRSIDVSRLRSLTVFGPWKSFYVSESMKVLRVLDLEDAYWVADKDVQLMVKCLPRLKFLSLRGCTGIHQLPSSLGDLRQLETLDVRYTSVVAVPKAITKLKKLQYIRAGTTIPTEEKSSTPHTSVPHFRRHRPLGSVDVPAEIGKLVLLHTLGVVNIATAAGRAILKELKKLTQLRKLGVSGVSKSNSKEFCSAISDQAHLESLSVRLSTDHHDCLDVIPTDSPLPLENLQSLKLYGAAGQLPPWINRLSNLWKLDLEMTISETVGIVRVLGGLKELSILRLSVKTVQDGNCGIHFCVMENGIEQQCYQKVKILEIACVSTINVTFGSQAMQELEHLKVCCCSGPTLELAKSLPKLKKVQLVGSLESTVREDLEGQVMEHPNKPALKVDQ